MNVSPAQNVAAPKWVKPVAAFAAVFGAMTLFSGGSVLFGPEQAQSWAGDYMSFVVWVNFLAGFFYLAAAFGMWVGRPWAFGLAAFIALATGLVALVFGYQVAVGAPFEVRTIGALGLRFGLWLMISIGLGLGRARPAS